MKFADDIAALLDKSANIFCVRLPGKTSVISGYSAKLVEKPIPNSFAISDFSGRTHFIANDSTESDHEPSFDSRLNEHTSMEDYDAGFQSIITELKKDGGKVVYSRVIKRKADIDVPTLFDKLCMGYPRAYVFMYRTTMHGLWIGASPELLMKAARGRYDTMSLAGTRPTGTTSEWDGKNREEQQMVTDFITNTLSRYYDTVYKHPVQTLIAGPVEHLCTHISAQDMKPEVDVMTMLSDLSPTPALCGLPRNRARTLIKLNERHDRMCYGGFTGIFKDNDRFEMYVNLRSMKVSADGINIFVGGGMTHLSELESEWLETERKASTLLSLLHH